MAAIELIYFVMRNVSLDIKDACDIQCQFFLLQNWKYSINKNVYLKIILTYNKENNNLYEKHDVL